MATQAKRSTTTTGQENSAKSAQMGDSQSPIADKMKDSLHHSVDALAERVGKTEEKLRHTASSSADVMADKQQAVQAQWQQSSIRRYATENPLAAAGIAFAAGMLLTSLLRRK
ncbi:DUF883 domain-containing protein [Neptunicella sp. SCSIO 80796]|uniref:DUF883 domain-containing protein n=1 Tax=Neptunicella plasticusilytica TaxID=3117012 RepID=UPI003A4E040E